MDKYEIIISWSKEDAAYVADIPEPPGCIGNSYEEAPAPIRELTVRALAESIFHS